MKKQLRKVAEEKVNEGASRLFGVEVNNNETKYGHPLLASIGTGAGMAHVAKLVQDGKAPKKQGVSGVAVKAAKPRRMAREDFWHEEEDSLEMGD